MERLILSALFLVLVVLTAPAQQKQPNPMGPIIDVHVHVYGSDPRWDKKIPNPINGQPMTATTEQAHMQATLAEMRKHNVVKAVVSSDYQAALRWKSAYRDLIIASY